MGTAATIVNTAAINAASSTATTWMGKHYTAATIVSTAAISHPGTPTTWMGTAATIFKVANKALDIDTKYKRSPKGSPTAKFCDLHTDEQRLHRPTQC